MTQFKIMGQAAIALALVAIMPAPRALFAQDAAAAAPAAVRQLGTVKAIEGSTLTISTDKGASYTIHADAPAKFVLLAPGSTDLKTATTADISSVSVGDRVLVSGRAGDDATAITASRVVVMKSGDIAQRNEQFEADWQKRGSGGIVSAVDPASGNITVKSGSHTVVLKTTPATIYRRYANGSIKYSDTRKGSLQDIAAGDQLRVRGDHSEDGSTITAEEVVSGSFKNIAGTVVSIDAPGQAIVVKDLAAKKNVTVHLSAATDMRTIPAEMATRLAMRSRAGAAGSSPAGAHGASNSGAPATANGGGEGAQHRMGQGGPGGASGAGARTGDLSQMIARLPSQTLADLKPGAALMIVGTANSPADPVTAITILSGVEPILAATPAGSAPMTLSPWNLGANGGGADAGGAGIQ